MSFLHILGLTDWLKIIGVMFLTAIILVLIDYIIKQNSARHQKKQALQKRKQLKAQCVSSDSSIRSSKESRSNSFSSKVEKENQSSIHIHTSSPSKSSFSASQNALNSKSFIQKIHQFLAFHSLSKTQKSSSDYSRFFDKNKKMSSDEIAKQRLLSLK